MKKILAGITPSGDGTLHIGNYLGAVKQFISLAQNNECFLFVADLHALTTIQNKNLLEKNIENLILSELALLGDLKNIIFFRQSDVPAHTELQSILNNFTPLGLIKRAHAYKDKLAKDVMEDDINLGLFNYPVLMAADILIYKPDLVPVGKDQKQHIEITRDIGEKFNKTTGKNIFKLPDGYIPEETAVIMGTDGKRKMSKSLGNIISIFDDEKIIEKQIMSTYTDPTRIHKEDPGHLEGNMVFTYLDYFYEFSDKFQNQNDYNSFKNDYEKGSIGDVEVKEILFSSIMKCFTPARKRFNELKNDPKKVKDILTSGAAKAQSHATKTMNEVRDALGITNKYSFYTYPNSSENDGQITIDDFSKIEVRVGNVIEATHPEKSEKLIRLVVDFGLSLGKRIIFTGVRGFGYTKDDFINNKFMFVTNLIPRKMIGEQSQGMILAVDGEELVGGVEKPIFIKADYLPLGAKVR